MSAFDQSGHSQPRCDRAAQAGYLCLRVKAELPAPLSNGCTTDNHYSAMWGFKAFDAERDEAHAVMIDLTTPLSSVKDR